MTGPSSAAKKILGAGEAAAGLLTERKGHEKGGAAPEENMDILRLR